MDEYKKLFTELWQFVEKYQTPLGEKKDIDWWRQVVAEANKLAENYNKPARMMLSALLDSIEDRSVRSIKVYNA